MRLWGILFFTVLLCACNNTPPDIIIDGILEVPENRDDPDSRTLKLAYKVLKAKDTNSRKAPIVYLQGGPGAETLIMEEFWSDHPLRNDRDIVLMDQRGTGQSEANCTELGNSLFDLMRQDLDIEDDYNASRAQLDRCREAIKQKGVDLAGYNSRENAADFEDLRKALGYDKWNLFGASYGTRLGLTIMRDFPNSVRSSILAGVLAPESDLFGDRIRSIDSSLFTVLRRCEENKDCNNRYPNLKERLLKVLKALESNPLRFDYKNKPFVLNLQDVFPILNVVLYDRQSIANVPLFIEALENGETEIIIAHLSAFESLYSFVNLPMLYSVTAYEEFPFYNAQDTEKAILQSKIGYAHTAHNLLAKLLADWHPFRATDIENQAVVSDIPTLMVSGRLDPATPVSNAAGAVKNFINGYEVIFQDESHHFYNSCFFQIAEDFLNNPGHKPNMDCSLERNPIEWNLSNPLQ
ncbi:alpha/beta fold hydrolase [uncultured Kriegella sp.]|uniref:alpha/beta fold hydrolase n=1 Tax=uncultured Kriegella sp. TaxID=1798910 RepID=UPI0030D904AE|tara:strand:- start:231376 stop:232773 length:1398 start_codon:yes stop_codon:yes gene_type:complete